MRDILTVIAGLVILVLATALVAPPFIDWEARRGMIEDALSRAAGVEVRTEGRIDLRLLPSPRMRLDQVRLGSSRPDEPSLRASFVKAEMALPPLLSGQIRFTETRVGRAEIRVPTTLHPGLPHGGRRGDWAFEDLRVAQLLVTATSPTTGRTDQIYAEGVSLEAPSLAGPWRVEGTAGGVPFRLGTGEFAADLTTQVRLVGGGDLHPRFDIDAKLNLGPEAGSAPRPLLAGTAKLLFGPPAQAPASGILVPVTVQASFKTNGSAITLDPVTVEAGEGGAGLSLAGTGEIDLQAPRLALKLEGRRLDLDSFLVSPAGREILAHGSDWALPSILPVALDIGLASIALGQEELADVALRAVLENGRFRVSQARLTAPGQTRVTADGRFGLSGEDGADGRVSIASAAPGRFVRYLGKLGLPTTFAEAVDNRPLEATANIAYGAPVASLRNLRLKLGEASLSGNVRYTAPEAANRGRLDAQLGIQGLDLNQLPQLSSVSQATRDLDLGLTLDARDVRHGDRPGAGRIAARILSDGPELVVETLEIAGLAGANARVAGRIAADGSGRIEGRVNAQRAAPLIDLLGSVWIGGVARLVPPFLREGDLDLAIVAERAAPDPNSLAPRLKTTARGRAAGGTFEADAVSADGRTESLAVRLGTDHAGRWVDRPEAAILRRPASLDLRGVRVPSGNFNVTLRGDLGGVRLTTTRPFALGADDDVVESGEAELASPDVTPFLVLLGDGAGVESPVPAQLRVTLGRDRDATSLAVSGRVAGEAVQAQLAARSRADIVGSLSLDRLSMPWLASAFALNAPPDPRATALWSGARFGQSRRLLNGGQATFKVRRLDLGRGLQAQEAAFELTLTPDGLAIRNLDGALAGGRLTGALAINRQGTLASFVGEGAVRDVSVPALVADTPLQGRLTANLRFGASGETLATAVANLSGAGEVRLADVQLPEADPTALDRALAKLLRMDDPLGGGRIESAVVEELGRAPFRAGSTRAPATMVAGVVRLSPLSADAGAALWQGAAAIDLKGLTLDARGTLNAKAGPKGWTGSPPYIGLAWRGPLARPVREVEAGPLTNGLAAIVLQRELDKIETFEMDRNEQSRLNQRRDMDRARRAAEEAARRAAEEAGRRAAAEEAQRQVRLREQQAAEEAARQARLREQQAAEEAARQARLREQQAAEEAARQARLREQRAAEEAARQARLREQRAVEEARQSRLRDEAADRSRAENAATGGSALPPLPPPLDIRPAPQIQVRPGG